MDKDDLNPLSFKKPEERPVKDIIADILDFDYAAKTEAEMFRREPGARRCDCTEELLSEIGTQLLTRADEPLIRHHADQFLWEHEKQFVDLLNALKRVRDGIPRENIHNEALINAGDFVEYLRMDFANNIMNLQQDAKREQQSGDEKAAALVLGDAETFKRCTMMVTKHLLPLFKELNRGLHLPFNEQLGTAV